MSVLLPSGHSPKRTSDDIAPSADQSLQPDTDAYQRQDVGTSRYPVAAWRFAISFCVAAVADVAFMAVSPLEALEVVGDVLVALILCGILGFNWIIVPALLAEAIPALEIFPSWTLAVMAIAGIKAVQKKVD